MLETLKKNPEYPFLAGLAIFIYICFQLALMPTWTAYQRNRALKAQMRLSQDLFYQPEQEIQKNKNLDAILKVLRIDSLSFRNNTLSGIAFMADRAGLKLTEVPKRDSEWNTPVYFIEKLDFEGDYASELRFLDELESEKRGYIRSFQLFSIRSTQNLGQKNRTILRIYLEMAK